MGVTQGSNPVVGAQVVARIQKEGGSQPIEISLRDAGFGSDIVANDGLYSRYFTNFDTSTPNITRYTLDCYVKSTNGSMINKGSSWPTGSTAAYPLCLGSNTQQNNSSLEPTGNFTRFESCGDIEIKNANQVNYTPGEVNDFTGQSDAGENFFTLSFTSTGKTLDAGKISDFKVYYTAKMDEIKDVTTIKASLPNLNTGDVANPASLIPQEAGTPVTLQVLRSKFTPGVQYFFRIYSEGDNPNLFS